MRARALIAGVAVLTFAGLLAVHAEAADAARLFRALQLTPVAGAPPPLALERLDDRRTLALGDLRGRLVLLYFWATW